MAYTCPRDLDGFMPHMSKPDTRLRQQIGADLLTFLADPSNPITCDDIGQLIDGLLPWMHSSNYKVSSNGIEVMTYLIDRLGTDFRPYLQTVLPNVIDRLGDAKDTVREKSQLLLLKLLERNVISPQTLLERLTPGFTHKNAKIREEVLRCLVNTLNEHGAQSLTLNKFIPDIVKLLSDPTATVRDTAFSTLVDLYKHVGEKLRMDLQRRNLVPASKWPTLSARFDEARNNGELLMSAKSVDYSDEVDRALLNKQATSAKKNSFGSSSAVKQRTVSATGGSMSALNRASSMRKLQPSSGAVDEDTFIRSFEDVPSIQLFSHREVTDHMKNVYDTISDSSKDWNKRQDALKKIRSLMIAGALNYEEFYVGLKLLEIPLQAILKDLRSQVVREACITIAYLAQTLQNKFEKTAEYVLSTLIQLIQNSAKVMATAGVVTVRFIIQNCPCSRFIPIIASNAATSKSKDIRRCCCEFLEFMVYQWPTHSLEKYVSNLQEAIKKGVADADPEARVSSRKAFKGFKEHFPDHAEVLLQSLDLNYRRILQGEQMSASSSNNNLAVKTPKYGRSPTSATDSGRRGFRSNSAIDLQAAQRAKARQQYAAMARNKITSGTASLPRPKKIAEPVSMQSPERLGRTRSRNSQSQPTSRSGSPSSRLAYLYNRSTEHDSPRPRRLSSGIPRSTQGSRDASRETSPNRGTLGRLGNRRNERPPLSPASRPVLAQKILQQSREAETALADAFNDSNSSGDHYRSPRKVMRSVDRDHSDESETSSVCSERSFDSFRRPSDDINEIIAMCASTTWQERKDGLLSLQCYMNSEIMLSSGELKHLTEIFTRMFMDSHTKGLSVFLDTLQDFIKIYKNELHFWTYILLQRVFLKIGSEVLNSIQSKLMATLEIIKINFPTQLLIANVYKFFVDATQTPNVKVKTVVLTFLTSLCQSPEAGNAIQTPPAQQALQKIILFTQDSKSIEIRNAAKSCIVAMWNCNTARITMLLADLPKEQQDIAQSIVHSHMRKSSTGSEPGSPAIATSPKPLSPVTPTGGRNSLDQEEIYKSLRKTTAEIQNYSFETLGSKLDRDRDTTSQDSGISQMSVGNDIKDMNMIEERMEELSVKSAYTTVSGTRSLPYNSVNGVTETDCNGFRSLGDVNGTDVVKCVLDNCVVDKPLPLEEKRQLFLELIKLIESGQTEGLILNFKKLLRIALDHLNESDSQMKVIVMKLLTAIFAREEMKQCWIKFVELLILRVLNCYCDEKREVARAAEEASAAMVDFPFNTVVSTLSPMIVTGSYPSLLGAIKMLTKFIENHKDLEITNEQLNQIMPGLVKGSDHAESPVRKSSIFCMVALHKVVGEERLSKYFQMLSGSKVKLLRLYIGRGDSTNSTKPTENS